MTGGPFGVIDIALALIAVSLVPGSAANTDGVIIRLDTEQTNSEESILSFERFMVDLLECLCLKVWSIRDQNFGIM
jgi:hypothetical protein